MLQIIRNVFTGWIAVIFIVLLIIPFAFWGIDSYFGGATSMEAAVVNGEEITLAEYQKSYQNIRRQFQEISPELAEQNEFIRQQTLDKLIDRILLLEIKNSLNLRVSDNQVRSTIYEIPAFNNPEGFDNVTYQNFLLTSGYTPVMFENEIREDMSLEQLQAGLLATTLITPFELKRIVAFERQTRDIQYTSISYDSYRDEIEVTNEEIQAYYDENSTDFTSPEQVKLAYISLSLDDIAREVEASEEDVRAYFENFRDNYSLAERRKVRQILVYAEEGTPEGTDETAEPDQGRQGAGAIADEIYNLVTTENLSFEEARDRFDSDEITVEISDFGFLNQGVLDPEVDEVVFSIEPGEISEPIETQYGYQIVVVDETTGGDRPEFEQVEGEVETDYRREQAERQFFELYDELAVLTYENPDTLEIASESLGLPVRESGYISRFAGDNSILNDQKVITAAFSDDVLLERNNSELIELSNDHVVVIRVIEHQEEQILPLAEVRESIEARLLFEKGAAMTRQTGEAIMASLEEGVTPEAIAEEYSLVWAERNNVGRNNTDVNRQILQIAFRTSRPEDNNYSINGAALAEGDFAVVIVKAVHDIDPESLTDEDIQSIGLRVLQNRASRSWSNLITELRADADIEVFEDNLN